mmetsp:Transcript_9883/g.20980  ORF Transcript_9883/g.20980 Transcript_9883/m.20980 type:complete len:317 (+) Transcript_9883:79-1029(+)
MAHACYYLSKRKPCFWYLPSKAEACLHAATWRAKARWISSMSGEVAFGLAPAGGGDARRALQAPPPPSLHAPRAESGTRPLPSARPRAWAPAAALPTSGRRRLAESAAAAELCEVWCPRGVTGTSGLASTAAAAAAKRCGPPRRELLLWLPRPSAGPSLALSGCLRSPPLGAARGGLPTRAECAGVGDVRVAQRRCGAEATQRRGERTPTQPRRGPPPPQSASWLGLPAGAAKQSSSSKLTSSAACSEGRGACHCQRPQETDSSLASLPASAGCCLSGRGDNNGEGAHLVCGCGLEGASPPRPLRNSHASASDSGT